MKQQICAGKIGGADAFTFVEVLAALVFLGILMPVLISALLLASRTSVIAERSAIAAQLAENQLGELMIGNEWSSGEARGDFGADFPNYRWELAQQPWEGGNTVTELTLTAFFQVQGTEHEVHLTTLASETQQQ